MFRYSDRSGAVFISPDVVQRVGLFVETAALGLMADLWRHDEPVGAVFIRPTYLRGTTSGGVGDTPSVTDAFRHQSLSCSGAGGGEICPGRPAAYARRHWSVSTNGER